MKAILLAAGYATRLHPLTLNKPKGLLPVAGRPIMDYIADEIDTLEEVDEIIIISNHRFINEFEQWADRRRPETRKRITLLDDGSTDDSNKLGAIGDLAFCIDKLQIDDEAVIIASDNFFTYRLKDAFDYYRLQGRDTVLAKKISNRDELSRMAVAIIDENNVIRQLEEKPKQPVSDLGIYATYFYRKDTLRLIRKYLADGNKPDAPGYFVAWLYQRKDVMVYIFDGECYDIGTPEAYRDVDRWASGHFADKAPSKEDEQK
ncbi:MAG TPA: nucleotidyltransferase family protein [Clostridiales bacterium]|nr:nucleotidyltransferase family protein [Clostridiales bacterium]